MASTKQCPWSSFALHLFTIVGVLVYSPVLTQISSPAKVIAVAGQNATFMFNCSRKLLAAKFGLHGNENYPVPKFITVINNQGTARATCGNDLNGKAASYKGRVLFTGDLEKGRAWFQISNLSANDTNLYSSSIRRNLIDRRYKLYLIVKLTVLLDTGKRSPPRGSERRFTEFEGIAVKNVSKHRIGKESSSTIHVAIKKAYRNISMKYEISRRYFRKKNKTITAGFHITFSKPINKTYANSFLKKAEQNNKLRGYNITCFENADLKPLPDKPSRLSPYLIATFVFIGMVLLLLITLCICCMCCPHLTEPFKKLFRKLHTQEN